MPMRMSGLISGLDTDSLISSLVSAKRLKATRATGEQTKLSWKQDIWKGLNKQLVSLRSMALNLRYSNSWAKKTTSVSDPAKASVITGDGATNAVQSLKINQLAKSGYMTGGVVEAVDAEGNKTGEKLTALSKMSDLGFTGDASFDIKIGDTTTSIDVNADSSISDVLNSLKNAGVNASFDEKNQRLFISSKGTGADKDFSITASTKDGKAAINALGIGDSAKKIDGQDAEIELNGATFTNSTNAFEINGLTITALGETSGDEEITLSTGVDTSGIYDQVKNFLKTYNSIVNEMDKLYNAASSSKYTPLTDEEKEALSDTEVEKYEQKIKDGLLKGDETISAISSALTGVMSNGIEINGKKVFLSDFGINTQNYLAAEENTSHSYHIDGDPDDEVSSGNADKLKGLIASDPDSVSGFFTKLSQSLYSKLDELSSRIANRRTYGSFFEDQTMKKDYTDYGTKISDLEKKANDYEDNLYAKFSKMEAAMAKLQSKTSALTGMFGN